MRAASKKSTRCALVASTFVASLIGFGASAHASATSFDVSSSSSFRLPWGAGASQYLTQDANDACCSDHVGANKYAYDFALPSGGAFDVTVPADGTIVHVKMSSKKGCADASCVSDANYVVIDHGDGTQTTMLHLAQGSLDPSITCGGFVRRGQRLAVTGSTGWSTGIHLHVERDQVKKTLGKTCECGTDGMACAPSTVEWSLFWPSQSQPNVPVEFDEWKSAAVGGDRRGLIGPSRNADDLSDVVYLDADRFTAISGDWSESKDGGRKGTFHYAKAGALTQGSMSLKGAVPSAGLYEVWAYVPLSSLTSAQGAELSIEIRSGSNKTAVGTLSEGTIGGAFHRVRGLERVKLSGNETLLFGAADADDAKVVVVDGIVLHRVVDDVMQALKLPAQKSTPTNVQLGLAIAPKGGGMMVQRRDAEREGPSPSTYHPLFIGVGLGVAALAGASISVRRRRVARDKKE